MARSPKPISNILTELLARRGYARVESASRAVEAWRQAAGDQLAALSRPGKLQRGVLEVLVTTSTLVQDLGFQKQHLIRRLHELLPDEKIRDLRFRVGPIE